VTEKPDKIVLTPAEKQKLIGQSHGLKPAVQIGKAGLTDAVVEQVRRAFNNAELLKVRILRDDRDELDAIARTLADKAGAVLVKRIGKVAILYRPAEGNDSGK